MRPFRLVRPAALAGALLCCLFPSSCTFVLDRSKVQCESDSDCSIEARGPEFEGYLCGEGNVCVKSAAYCTSNAQCIDANGGAENFVCNKETHGCVNLNYKNYCVNIHAQRGDLRRDDVILVGLHWASGLDNELNLGEVSLDYARDDFTRVGGIPQAGGASARPVAIVTCNIPPTEVSHISEVGREMVDHLLDTVGVKVLVGPLLDEHLLYALNKANQTDTFIFTVRGLYTTAAQIPGQATHSLFMSMSGDLLRKAYAKLVPIHEKRLRDNGATGDIKVAVVGPQAAADSDSVSSFLDNVAFNGKSGQENLAATPPTFAYLQYDADRPLTDQPIVQKVKEFTPDIIACSGGAECIDVMATLEKAEHTNLYYWILGYEAIAGLDFSIYAKDDERFRFLGVEPGRADNDPLWLTFRDLYLKPKLKEDLNITRFAATLYDIGYMVHLGLTAIGSNPITGTSFHDALLNRFKFSDPVAFTAKPVNVQPMTQALIAGQVLNANGPGFNYEIDPTGQLADPAVDIWCIRSKAAAGPDKLAGFLTSSGLRYDARTNTVVGTNTCF